LPKELKFAVGPPPNQIKLGCQEKVGGATSGGLLDVKHPPARVHRGRVRDDHLAREHRLDHILGGSCVSASAKFAVPLWSGFRGSVCKPFRS